MALKPQDIIVLLKLVLLKGQPWTHSSLANALGLSPSQIHSAIKRCCAARLLTAQSTPQIQAHTTNIEEFMIHAVKYLCPPTSGEPTRGIPTMWAAAPLHRHINSQDLPPVWPAGTGTTRGYAFAPIHKCAIMAATHDTPLYELLVCLDAIRGGRARERTLGIKYMRKGLQAQ